MFLLTLDDAREQRDNLNVNEFIKQHFVEAHKFNRTWYSCDMTLQKLKQVAISTGSHGYDRAFFVMYKIDLIVDTFCEKKMKETAFIAQSSSDLVGFSHSVLLLISMTHLYDSYLYENSLELDEQKRTIQLNVNSNPVL